MVWTKLLLEQSYIRMIQDHEVVGLNPARTMCWIQEHDAFMANKKKQKTKQKNKKTNMFPVARSTHCILSTNVAHSPGGVTLTDQCVHMIVPNFAKKGCILKVCLRTQMYAIF